MFKQLKSYCIRDAYVVTLPTILQTYISPTWVKSMSQTCKYCVMMIGMLVTAVLMMFFLSCNSGSKGNSYNALLEEADAAFAGADYDNALEHFLEAKNQKPGRAAAYNGIGWSYLKLDSLDLASTAFNDGSTKTDPSADLFAGWGFVLNALQDFAQSNIQTDEALTMDGSWTLSLGDGLGLSASDLHVLKAENHFLLGEFASSLAEIKIVNPQFSLTTVVTDDDKALLAQEIENQRGLVKGKLFL